MKVKDLMTKEVLTIKPDDLIDKVFLLFNIETIRHLPVVVKGKLVGIVSDRDLKKALGSLKTAKISGKNKEEIQLTIQCKYVRNIMRRRVITISSEAKAYEAASIMVNRKLGALPVVKNEELVGIITTTDVLRAFIRIDSATKVKELRI